MTTIPVPEEGGTYARLAMTEAFSVAVDELDRFMSRLCRHDPRLVLEPEGDQWIIVDTANAVVMIRTPDRMTAVRFARRFTILTEGATLDEVSVTRSGGGSPGDDGGVGAPPDSRSAGEPTAVDSEEPANSAVASVSQAGGSEPASPADNVIPLYRNHAEEIAAVVAGVHPGLA